MKEYEMDKDVLHLIDNLDQLIPQDFEKLSDEDLICECFCVTVGLIREICPKYIDLDLLNQKLNLGGGCKSCIKRKEDWIHRVL